MARAEKLDKTSAVGLTLFPATQSENWVIQNRVMLLPENPFWAQSQPVPVKRHTLSSTSAGKVAGRVRLPLKPDVQLPALSVQYRPVWRPGPALGWLAFV